MRSVRSAGVIVGSIAIVFAAVTGRAQSNRVLVPGVGGPLSVTPQSYPFAAADHQMTPFDLAKAGYVEEEFLVSGTANVYDWQTDRSLKTIASGPYTTRILVRRPRLASAFSGAVWVEPMYTPRRWDWPMMWGYLRDGLIARGDAWVGVTMPGANLAGLKRFDAQRYATLAFPNPTPAVPCAGTQNLSDTESGLRWDALSQVAALLKSNATGRPLNQFRIGAVYLTVQAGDLETYMNAIHPVAHIYDGFLARAPFTLTSINRCAAAPAADDPRQVVRDVGVPVIAVAGEGDLVNTYVSRRNDSDAPGDRYRLYEVAGAAHIDRFAYLGFPSFADQAAAGNAQGTEAWPFTAPCTPSVSLMNQSLLRIGYDVAMDALDRWTRRGTVPKRAARVETRPGPNGTFTVVADTYGNGRGGVRTPYLDVPLGRYVTSSPGPGNCPEIGHFERFDQARLKQLHGSFERYAQQVRAAIAKRASEGWLTKADAERLTTELIEDERAKW
ncbi:MAG TPA: alpha/beta hydrolase domain-containing protein [Vicinamibacterales bacterium]|nr:alpha/beta hydrolase domain-containing protein [Vicinamibacterales bacterium]